jgi:cbb3-type cytochrome oxidase maturation protein
MNIVFVLIPLSLLLAIAGFLAFRWAVRNGQFEDTKTPAMRALFDEPETKQNSAPVRKE